MKVGVLARSDERGLAHQTWEVVRHLQPEKVLVVRVPSSERRGHHHHPDRYPDATTLKVDDSTPDWALPENDVREWLEGLDVVYTAETFYDDRIPTWAREMDVATVIHANPEWYRHHRGDIPEPSQWWVPTPWRLKRLPRDACLVPMPCPTDRWDRPVTDDRAVTHPAGVVAAKDRNGTEALAAAAQYMPDVTVYISAQEGLRRLPDLPNLRAVEPVENYWDSYTAPVMVLPRRYGGLCLPVIEACGAGAVPVLPDVEPNSMWPAALIPATQANQTLRCQGGTLTLHDCSPQDIAATVLDVFDNLDDHRTRVRDWVGQNSWDALAPLWRDELALAVEARQRPPKPASASVVTPLPDPQVSVLIPYTEDRQEIHEWVKARYLALHPDWEIIESYSTGPWCKATAVQAAVDRASGGVLVVADCDSYTDPATLTEAAEIAAKGRWVVPHRNVYRLNEASTRRALTLDPTETYDHLNASFAQRPYKGAHGGGIVVLPRWMWDDCPLDDRFVGHGLEDLSWGDALETLHGKYHRVGGDLVHLWHTPVGGRGFRKSASSTDLHRQYRAAHGSPRLMRALVDRCEPAPPAKLDKPATFQTPSPRLRVKMRDGSYVLFRGGTYTTDDADTAAALRLVSNLTEVT